MSEYADITIKSLSLYWFRNYLDPDIVSLFFNKDDLLIIPNCKIDEDDEDAATITKYQYITTVKNAKERLDAYGFGLNNLEKLFNSEKHVAVDYSSFLNHLRVDFDQHEERARERIDKKITFQKWKNSMKKIINFELSSGNITHISSELGKEITTESDKVIYYNLKDTDVQSHYGLKTEIIRLEFIFRLILEFCPENEKLILDFSDIQYWDDDCIEKALNATDKLEKNIVLVEGTSDKDILEFGLKYLYPHLTDLYYFMDFDDGKGAKREGSASSINKTLITFYLSKIRSNFIGVYDNDSVGYMNKGKLLDQVRNMPDNIKVLCYPEIDFLRKYPTLAPNGDLIYDDINKKAASIELYLPDSIIKIDNNYLPIEWESRTKFKLSNGKEEALYQGVISNKERIKDLFHEKRKRIEKQQEEFNRFEWDRLDILLKSIINVFG